MSLFVFPFPRALQCLIQGKENHFLKTDTVSPVIEIKKKPGAFELLQIVLTSTLSPVLL